MRDELEPDAQRAIEAIEAYLARHPAAADSEQGIAQWWLLAMGVDVPIEQVQRALAILAERGVVSRTALPGGRAMYRAARRKTDA